MESLSRSIALWNEKYPIDRWWRKTHSITFGSSLHRDMDYVSMCFEYLEDKLMKTPSKKDEDEEENVYTPGKGNFLKKQSVSQEISDDEFDNFSLDD